MPKRNRSQRKLLVLFNVISCIMVLVFALIIYQQARKNENYDEWIIHTYEVLRVAHRVVNNTSELESSYRGYFLTGSVDFLTPVALLEGSVDADIIRVRNMVIDNDEQIVKVNQIKDSFDLFRSLHRRQSQIYVTHGATGLIIADIQQSQTVMNTLQTQLDKFINTELTHLEYRISLGKQEQLYHIYTIVAGATIAIACLILANILILALTSWGTKTARRLEDMEELYGLIMENMNDGLFDYRPTTNQILFSGTYRKQLGYSLNELPDVVETGFDRLLHPDDRERVWKEINQYIAKKIPKFSTAFRLRHKKGGWMWILSRALGSWNRKGEMVRLVGIHTDITAQKKQEEALRELNKELESFTYIASHDLRSPLVNMKGFAKEIETSIRDIREKLEASKGELSEQDRKSLTYALETDIPESLDFINSAVERMDMLTGAILNLSRIGRRVYKSAPVDVTAIVNRCLQSLNYEINKHQAQTIVEKLPQIEADELAMEQIVSNILENGIKYLTMDRPGFIRVAGVENENEIIYSFEDNGRGIRDNDREKVFDIFRRASNTEDVRGVGMGLAFVRATVRKMNGRIWYDSELNKGTVFYVSLPKSPANGETANV